MQRIEPYLPTCVFDFSTQSSAAACAAAAREQLNNEGVIISKVMPTSETNGLSEKYQSLCARQNGTAKGARTMNGVTKMSGNIAKPFTGRIDSAAAYRKASGSSLSPHIDSNPHSDILSHGNRTDAAIAELVKGSEGVPFTVQTFVCTHSVCKGGAGFVFFTDPDDPHPASPPDEAYFEKTDKDFCKLDALGFAKFRLIRRVELQSGWAVSWVSSAIIHSNQAPYMDALDKQRYGFYVCRIPAGILSVEERAFNAKEKEKLAYAGRTTDHYPNLLHPSYGGSHYSNSGQAETMTNVLYGKTKGEDRGSPVYPPDMLSLMRVAL